jgi:hypothetical protein
MSGILRLISNTAAVWKCPQAANSVCRRRAVEIEAVLGWDKSLKLDFSYKVLNKKDVVTLKLTVPQAQTKAKADALATLLKPFGNGVWAQGTVSALLVIGKRCCGPCHCRSALLQKPGKPHHQYPHL